MAVDRVAGARCSGIGSLVDRPVGELRDYSERAKQVLRETAPLSRREWLKVYEHGLRAAYEQHDLDGLTQLVGVATARFDVEGQLAEAVSEVDFAMSMTSGLPDALLVLLSERAPLVAAAGDIQAADRSLSEAESLVSEATHPSAVLKFRTGKTIVDAIVLRIPDLGDAVSLIRALEDAGRYPEGLVVTSWLIPYLVASGQPLLARPWVRALAIRAEIVGHPWRRADAAAFNQVMSRAPEWREAVPGGEPIRYILHSDAAGARNWLARHRLAMFDGYVATRRHDEVGLRAARAQMQADAQTVHPAYRGGLSSLEAFADAVHSLAPAALTPPDRVSLMNLGATLAAAEAVAISGTQADAVIWQQWMSSRLPASVRTSVEWPVSRLRVQGLIEARAGAQRTAVSLLRESVRWADEIEYPAEAATSQLQLAEILERTDTHVPHRRIGRMRESAWRALRAFGIDPTPIAYAAARAVRREVEEPLTPREVETLRLLAEGLSYRAAAETLGLSWRTVQNRAHAIYEKLGVSNKVAAVAEGQRIGLIPRTSTRGN